MQPKIVKLCGELLSAEAITGDVTLITIQDSDNEVHTIGTSNNYWKKVGKIFPEGAIVSCTIEERIEGKTTYLKDGVETTHTSSGNSLAGITKFSQSAWERELQSKTKDSDLAVISAVEVDRVSAVAQYLSAYVNKR